MRGLQAEAEGEGDNQRREGLNRQKLREKEKIGEFFCCPHKIAVMQCSTFYKFSNISNLITQTSRHGLSL